MAIDLKQTAIDPDNPEVLPTRNTQQALRDTLSDVQGNILKSHGRDHSHHLIITFKHGSKEEREKARAWLAQLVTGKHLTSAMTQWEEAKAYQKAKELNQQAGSQTSKAPPEQLKSASDTFVGVMLSAAAYDDLRLGAARKPDDPAFREGAKKRAPVLHDPPPAKWEAHFQRTLHALVIVADDDKDRLAKKTQKLKAQLKGVYEKLAEETGEAMRIDEQGNPNPGGPVREHFGFVDGISQPLFFARDIEKARVRQGGIDQYDPSAPLDQVLVKDPGGNEDTAYGSYFVYRKLEQDVDAFRAGEEELAKEIARQLRPKEEPPKPTPEERALAGAYLMGRFKDGTPVVERDTAGLGAEPNNFTFDADVDGVRCPFQAHARKTNPRGDKQRQFGVPLTQERTRRIARRAISYGPVTLKPPSGAKVGLLFLCAQSSIPDQFEFIQVQWANNETFLRPGSGIDPVIGSPAPEKTPEESVKQRWPKFYGSRNELDFTKNPPAYTPWYFEKRVGNWVIMKGGEYFFVPSLSALTAFARVKEGQ